MKDKKQAAMEAWIAWTKARHGWTKKFAIAQADLYFKGDGRTNGDWHDVTCSVFHKYFLPIFQDC